MLILVQLYPTGNVWPRPQEIVELYLHNRRYLRRAPALWHAARRRIAMFNGLPPLRMMDNLGLAINVLRADAE